MSHQEVLEWSCQVGGKASRFRGTLEDVEFPTEVSVEGEGHRAFSW